MALALHTSRLLMVMEDCRAMWVSGIWTDDPCDALQALPAAGSREEGYTVFQSLSVEYVRRTGG